MKITYTKKIIKNLGNYENVTIEIVVEDEVNIIVTGKQIGRAHV